VSLISKGKSSSFLGGLGTVALNTVKGAGEMLLGNLVGAGVQKVTQKLIPQKGGLPALPGGGSVVPFGPRVPLPAPGAPFSMPSTALPFVGGDMATGIPSGWHFAKDGSGRLVRNRRMNACNPRAFRRAVRRVKGARRFAKEVNKLFPTTRRRAPAPRGHHRHLHHD